MLEAVLAVGLLGALFVLLMSVYLTCARALAQGDRRTSLAGELQVATQSLVSELERSAYDGLSLAPGTLSLLSPKDEQGRVDYDAATGSLRWSRYRIFYLDPGTHELRRRDVNLAPSATQRVAPAPLQDLEDYRSQGTVVARFIYGFEAERQGNRLVHLTLRAERERRGRTEPEKLARSVWARIHN